MMNEKAEERTLTLRKEQEHHESEKKEKAKVINQQLLTSCCHWLSWAFKEYRRNYNCNTIIYSRDNGGVNDSNSHPFGLVLGVLSFHTSLLSYCLLLYSLDSERKMFSFQGLRLRMLPPYYVENKQGERENNESCRPLVVDRPTLAR